MYSLPCKNFQRIEHNKGIVHFLATKKSTKFSKHRHKHSLILYKGKLIQCFMSQYSFSKSTELEKQNKILKKKCLLRMSTQFKKNHRLAESHTVG